MWLIVFSLFLTSPAGGFELIFKGLAPSDEFYSDHLDNIYFLDDHKLIKIATTSGAILEYGSLSIGEISSADVSNPFQILLFYRDFNQILFLDNKLSRLRSEINLSDLDIEQAILACSSGRGGFWVFSDRGNHLVFFDQQFRNSHQSMIISSITGSNIKPVYMTEAQNQLYLHIPGEGILVFDQFASYKKTIPYYGPDRFQVMNGKIIYFQDGKLLSLDISNNEIIDIVIPLQVKIDGAYLQPKKLCLLEGDVIKLFRIN